MTPTRDGLYDLSRETAVALKSWGDAVPQLEAVDQPDEEDDFQDESGQQPTGSTDQWRTDGPWQRALAMASGHLRMDPTLS